MKCVQNSSINIRKTGILILVLIVSFFSHGQTPSYKIIEKLPVVSWSKTEKGADLSDKEKLDLLKMLPAGERIEFEMGFDEETNETTYWEFNIQGLYYLDLDYDGDLDLLYSAQNGAMMQTATKVFYNNNNVLDQVTYLRDGILDIKRNKESCEIYTLFQPCCDSYTTRIDQYRFSDADTAVFVESISIIGRLQQPYKGMLDFSTEETVNLNDPSFYAFSTDLKQGYFGKRNNEVKTKLKQDRIIELHKVEGTVKAGVLQTGEFKDEKYYLVITEPLNNLPKMPISLYEWSQGDGRRLVGWVKADDVK